MEILGIDIGGTGIKGALVNIEEGEMVTERFRLDTPKGAKPDDVVSTLKKVIEHFDYSGPVGCGFPAAIVDGVVRTASNIDKSWIGININQLLSEALNTPVVVNNDVDVAGVAEMNFGVGKDVKGTIIMAAFGTGIGSAIFTNGELYPNSEFGHVFFPDGYKAEKYAANSIRKDKDLSYTQFGRRVNKYFQYMESLFYPSMFIMGGGVSKKFDNFSDELTVDTPIVPAELLNNAGIVGAAYLASKLA